MFKNITVFRYPASSDFDIDVELATAAEDHRLAALGTMEMANAGFVPAVPDEYVPGGNGYQQIRIGFQEKILPPAVVNLAVQAKVQKIVRDEDRKVGGRERKRIKDDMIAELLPRAFTRRKDVQAIFDTNARRLLIDAASQRQSEDVVSQIREALGSFPAIPGAPEESPQVTLTGWLVDPSRLPARLALADEVVLYDPAQRNGRTWRGRRTDLEAEDVTEHLRAGLVVKQLGLVYDERLSFVLDEDLTVRKFRMLDESLSELDDEEFENAESEARAVAFLFVRETRAMLDYLDEIFDVRKPE